MIISTLGSRQSHSQANAILSHPFFLSIAEKHSCSPAVVSLSWAVQRGVVIIPKSGSPHRIEENLRLVTLSSEEMETMNQAHNTDAVGRVRLSDYIAMTFHVPGKGEALLLGWTKQDFGLEDEEGNWLV
jgi:glycerol 2-dehydrogenase (NADP+)